MMRTEMEDPRCWNRGSSRPMRRAKRPCIASLKGIPSSSGFYMQDGWLKVDFINVATSVTGSVGLVPPLWHHGSQLASGMGTRARQKREDGREE